MKCQVLCFVLVLCVAAVSVTAGQRSGRNRTRTAKTQSVAQKSGRSLTKTVKTQPVTQTRLTAQAQSLASQGEVVIQSLDQNGVITWANVALNSTCRVEWASSLTGSWTSDWSSLQSIVVTNDPMSAHVPMFYRVKTTLNLSQGLVAYYPLNGDGNDESGGGQHGTLVGSPTTVTGAVATALALDGVDDRVSLPGDLLGSGLPQGTFACWVRRDATNAGVIFNRGIAAVHTAFQIGVNTNGEWSCNFNDGFPSKPTSNVPLGDFTHIGVTWTGSKIKYYLNGVACGDYAFGGSIPAGGSETVDIGRDDQDVNYFKGTVDDLRFYNRALFPYEILALAGGQRYKVISGDRTWHQAKADAESRGGHLATITSEAENNVVRAQLKAQLGDLNNKVIWIGATDENSEGNWEWVTGEPWGWTYWLPGEPNNINPSGENYAAITCTYSLEGRWNDVWVNAVYSYYLLEIE